MSTDTAADQPQDESLEDLRAKTASRAADFTIEDEANQLEDLELPGADLSHEELVVQMLPKQDNEFTCRSCFLVRHRSQRATPGDDTCHDCA